MQKEILDYSDFQKENVKRIISVLLTNEQASSISQKAFSFYFGATPQAFQQYYVQIVNNREYYLSSTNFFRVFKQRYSLQGIDNNFLDLLETQKELILQHIDKGNIAGLYFTFFASAQIQHGSTIINKNLGSFFAKLAHTFCPDKLCALDNPIKNYFGLGKESFYIAFIVVSQAYQEWAKENSTLMKQIRLALESNPIAQPYSIQMTNLKLLDLIFWHRANRTSKEDLN